MAGVYHHAPLGRYFFLYFTCPLTRLVGANLCCYSLQRLKILCQAFHPFRNEAGYPTQALKLPEAKGELIELTFFFFFKQ